MRKYIEIFVHLIGKPGLKMVLVLILGMIIGGFMFSGESSADISHDDHTDHIGETTWTCSMHPQIKLDEAGQCPICFMDLIPLTSSISSESSTQISLSETAAKLARIVTSPVRHGIAQSEVRLSGKISFDETRIKRISARFPGRLEHLYVDYTGIRVNRGDHLLEIYSPELYSVQGELLLAYGRLSQVGQSAASLKASTSTYQAVREKIKLMGLSDGQIDAIVRRGEARSVLQINSPITGVVTHKNAVEGKYVKTGEQIYSIADLSKVWLILEAYEKDLPWLTYGQTLTFSVPGLPGQTFPAHISYIDPIVDPKKQSITVRAILDNQQGLLKPGMLAEATISVTLNGMGQVVTPDISGQWACSMHPEVVEDTSGSCSICGMDLVPLEKISGPLATPSHALLIPASAILKTGKRAIVYVQVVQEESIKYELRDVILGPRVGSENIIIGGLNAGELVVSNGNFKIDSAMQIAGKPSMMSGNKPQRFVSSGHQHG